MSYAAIATKKPLALASNEPQRKPDGALKVGATEPIDYQGIKYERSGVRFAHVPLGSLAEHDISDKDIDALVSILPAGAFIAGGAVASLVCEGDLRRASDIDIFLQHQSAFVLTVAALALSGYKRVENPSVPNGVVQFELEHDSVTLVVQVINIAWFPGGIEEVLDGFDFVCTQFGIDVGAGELVFNPLAPVDYASDLLVAHRSENDESAAKRLRKYIAKGFWPTGATLVRARALGIA